MSVEFEPVRLGQRRRRLDPISLAAVVVAIGVTLAVLKPWGGESVIGLADASPASSVAAHDLAGPHATASVALPRIIGSSAGSTLSWSAVEPIVHRHEAWGVRAIVVETPISRAASSADRRLGERWFPVALDASDTPSVQVDPGDRAIVALGLTVPPAHTPLDVRIWRATSGGLDWVDIEAVTRVPSGGAFLYMRPGTVGGAREAWESGTYRIDALVDGSVRRFAVTIPDRFSNVPAPAQRPSLRETGPMIGAAKAPLSDLPVGLFATADGAALPLTADEGPPLDEAAAWLDLDPGTDRRPRSFVAAAYLPRATGLGVAFRTRSVVVSATVDRLAPEPLPAEAIRVDPGARDGTPSSVVLFKSPDGASWTAGVYRLSVVWADVEGLHEDAWHVELRPGPVRESPPLLAAARGWARFAGATGVILGTVEPLEGGSTVDVIRLVPLRPETAAYPAATGVGCGGTVIDTSPGILGFAYPADHYASTVQARIMLPFLRRDDEVVMTAAFGVPGLILAAPARIPTLPAATYAFTVGSGSAAQTYALCLGMTVFGD